MGDEGLEPLQESPGNTHIVTQGGAESGALFSNSGKVDPELQAVIDAWPALNEKTKDEIVTMVAVGSDQ